MIQSAELGYTEEKKQTGSALSNQYSIFREILEQPREGIDFNIYVGTHACDPGAAGLQLMGHETFLCRF